MRYALAGTLLMLGVGKASTASAQLPVDSLRLAIGFGVDTVPSPEHEIFALWRHYLTEPSDSIRATLWSLPERSKGPLFDLVGPYVYQGFSHFTVVQLSRAVGLSDAFVIRTLVAAVDASALDSRPLALYRVYATRENGRWVLANALPRTTRLWRRETFGRVTFVYPQSHPFHVARARATAAFVDSLARAFGLPRPAPITYYFTDDLSETLRAVGLEFFPLGGDTVGGRSNVVMRQVYVGSSANGEGYRHELSHVLLASEVSDRTSGLLAEGLMTWTGGSAGLTYGQLLPGLARYLSAHPEMTLQGIMENPPPRIGSLDVGYDGLAVLCSMIFAQSGLRGLRIVLSAGRDSPSVLAAAAQTLGVPLSGLDSLWRRRIGLP